MTRARIIHQTKGAMRGRGRVAATGLQRDLARERELKARLKRARTAIARPKGRLPNARSPQQIRAYFSAVQADNRWQLALDAAGVDRYSQTARQGAFAKLYRAKVKADEAMHKAAEKARASNPGFFGLESSATQPRRVTKIRPVVAKDTGERGEIIGTAPGGYVKVQWRNRAKPSLIKRSEIKRGRYPNVKVNPGLLELASGFQMAKEIGKQKVRNPKRRRYTDQEKRAIREYQRASSEEERYMGSVFVTPMGQRKHEDRVRAAYEECKRLGLTEHDYLRPLRNPAGRTSTEVRSPTRTRTSTYARTEGNITVTGGAGRGATTKVIVRKNPFSVHHKLATARQKKAQLLERKAKGIIEQATTLGHRAEFIEKDPRKVARLRSQADRLYKQGFAMEKRARDAGRYTQGATGKLPNPSVQSISKKFQGHASGAVDELKAASSAPSDLARIGKLVEIRIQGRASALRIPGAVVAVDTKERLWIAGNRSPLLSKKARPGTLLDCGEIEKIVYETAKSHIGGGKVYEYDHDFESPKPHLMIDSEGMPLIRGGGYTIKAGGITG